jgi:flagellar M-ring protein FliF
MEERVASLLAPVVGEGRVVVRVAATLDFTEKDIKTNRVLKDGSEPKSREINEEKYSARAPKGVASPAPAPAPGSDYGRRSETVQYEVGTETAHQTVPGGRVKQLTVAVLIDERSAPPVSTVGLEALVSNAVGIDRQRGDKITVQVMPFHQSRATLRGPSPSPSGVPEKTEASLVGVLVTGITGGIAALMLVLLATSRRPRRAPTPDPARGARSARNAALLRSWMQKGGRPDA